MSKSTTKLPKSLMAECPRCGSGDIDWCPISVRPYCAECSHWGAVNHGHPEDAVREWNAQVERGRVLTEEQAGRALEVAAAYRVAVREIAAMIGQPAGIAPAELPGLVNARLVNGRAASEALNDIGDNILDLPAGFELAKIPGVLRERLGREAPANASVSDSAAAIVDLLGRGVAELGAIRSIVAAKQRAAERRRREAAAERACLQKRRIDVAARIMALSDLGLAAVEAHLDEWGSP